MARLNNLFERYSYDSDAKKPSVYVIKVSAILETKPKSVAQKLQSSSYTSSSKNRRFVNICNLFSWCNWTSYNILAFSYGIKCVVISAT
jgi:hypothetical protein